MEVVDVILKSVTGAPAAELVLRAGADLVVRVHEAPPDGGRGIVSLAGQLLQARLPPNLAPGQTLAVRIVEASEEQVVLRVRDDGQPRAAGHAAHAAGALAVAGDPQLVKVATALVPPELALPLPNGDALELAVQPDAEQAEGGGDGRPGGGEAAFVLHSAALGPIEVRVRLDGGTVTASVGVDEAALPLARAALPELAASLERVTGSTARIGLGARPPEQPGPAPPRVAEGLDAYA